jgi:hypothetical protein
VTHVRRRKLNQLNQNSGKISGKVIFEEVVAFLAFVFFCAFVILL